MKQFLLIIVLSSTYIVSYGQTISDCDGAIELCDDFYTEDQSSLNTGNVYEFTGTCNAGLEQSSVWYTFTVQQDGTLSFILDPLNDNDDYDWGMFNITDGGCSGLGTTSPEVGCNSYGVIGVNGPTGISTANGGSGNSNGPGNLNGPPYNGDLTVSAGQTFAIVVMNWTNSLEGYTIDFSGSTASLYDNIPPIPVSAEIDCSNTGLVLVFSEPILISSVQSLDFEITGPGGNFTIIDAQPSTPGASSDDYIMVTFNQQITTPGVYTLTITDATGFVQDACGNLGEGSITFELFDPLTFTANTTTACNGIGGVIEIVTISGGQEPYVFRVNSVPQNDLIADNLIPGIYTADITDATGCQIAQELTVPNNLLTSTIGLQDTLSCLQPSVTIQGLNISPVQPINYVWSATSALGNIVSAGSSANPVVSEPGIYQVVITNSTNGCFIIETIEVFSGEVYGIDISQMVLPNIITPNKDGKNDIWAPFLSNDPTFDLTSVFDLYELQIFNRWGALVYETGNGNRTWNGDGLETGIYFYVLKYITECGTGAQGTKEGAIQLLR